MLYNIRSAVALLFGFVALITYLPGAQAAPAGSYAQTCNVDSFSGSVLVATCKDFSGRWAPPTTLNVSGCVGDIFNSGGRLTCNRVKPPSGSYQQSCSDINFDANKRLNAQCRRLDGRMTATALDTRSCRGDIANIDGRVTCNKGSADAPPGPYLQTCWNVVADGTTLSAVCRTRDGGDRGTTVLKAYSTCNPQFTTHVVNEDGHLTCETVGQPVDGGCQPFRGDPGCVGGKTPWQGAPSETIQVRPRRLPVENFGK